MYALTSEWHIEEQEELDACEVDGYHESRNEAIGAALKMADDLEAEFKQYAPGSWWRVDVYAAQDQDEFERQFEDSSELPDWILHLDETSN